jgi:hypothetical protein
MQGSTFLIFRVAEFKKKAEHYGKTEKDFEPITVITTYRPFKNFLFSIFTLAGLFPVLRSYVGYPYIGQNKKLANYLYARLNSVMSNISPDRPGTKNLFDTFDPMLNMNTTGIELRYLRGRCFKKIIVGSMTPLVESLAHAGY